MSSWAPQVILLSKKVADHIASWGSNWGSLDLRVDEKEGVALVSGYSKMQDQKLSVETPWMKRHYLWSYDKRPDVAVWYRVDPDIHEAHEPARRRLAVIPLEYFKNAVPSGWMSPGERSLPVLAVSGAGAEAVWSCWWVSKEGAVPALLHIVEEDASPLDFLRPGWPLDDLADASVTLLGTGSIGSAVADSLASYGVRHLRLVDPDRYLQHNVVRHQLPDKFIGQHKVSAIRQVLIDRWPDLVVETFPFDVIVDADVLRPILQESSVAVCTTDGVTPRRVVNHLAKRAGIPLVLACVLENGGYGEVLRVNPSTGCLLCHREMLVEAGSLDPEPSLDHHYGTGTRHLPMTAVGGDLVLVGDLAAKVTVATLLEQKGHWPQRLPGEQALVALRPLPDLPAPFDLERSGDMRWGPSWTSKPDCPTCSPP